MIINIFLKSYDCKHDGYLSLMGFLSVKNIVTALIDNCYRLIVEIWQNVQIL